MKTFRYRLSNRQPGRKLVEGVRRYGVAKTAAGAAELAALKVRRPAFSRVITTRDGLDIGFRYPSQLMPSLVLYRDISVSEIELLRSMLRPDSTYFDVGSGIGVYAVFAARVAGSHVHAFEPAPDNVATIVRNVEANGVRERVRVNACGVSDRDGALYVEKFGSNSFSYRVTEALDGRNGATPISTVMLDTYCARNGIDHVDLLNLDVEGHDQEVLRGARGLIERRAIGTLMLEIHYSFGPVYRNIADCGFTAHYYDAAAGSLRPISSFTPEALKAERPSPFNRRIVFTRG